MPHHYFYPFTHKNGLFRINASDIIAINISINQLTGNKEGEVIYAGETTQKRSSGITVTPWFKMNINRVRKKCYIFFQCNGIHVAALYCRDVTAFGVYFIPKWKLHINQCSQFSTFYQWIVIKGWIVFYELWTIQLKH